MTIEEFARLETELEMAQTLYGKEFDDWYEQARLTSVETYCRTGWLFYRIKMKAINDQLDAERKQGPGEAATGVQ